MQIQTFAGVGISPYLKSVAQILFTISLGSLLVSCATGNNSDLAGNLRSAEKQAPVVKLKTPGGHMFRYLPMPDADRTAVAINWITDIPAVERVHEVTARVGIELMLNGGAGGKAPEEIIADFEDLDSGSLLRIQPQEISGFIVSPEVHMQAAADIANLVITQPNFERKWFEREKKIILDHALERDSLVQGLAWNLFRELAIGDHAYKNFWSLRPIDEVRQISLEGVKAWHSHAFTKSGAKITAAGNASVEKIAENIDRVMTGLPEGTVQEGTVQKMRDFPAPVTRGRTVLLHQPDAPKSLLLLIGNLISHDPLNDLNIQLGMGVLGYGKQSRLFKAVRSGLRASYGFNADSFDMTRNHRLFFMAGEVETGKLQAALDEIKSTYGKFRDQGIGPVEFPIARKFYSQRVKGELKKPESVAYLIMESSLNNADDSFVTSMQARVDSLKRSEVNSAIKEGFPSYFSLLKIVVSPDADAISGACVITNIEDASSCR